MSRCAGPRIPCSRFQRSRYRRSPLRDSKGGAASLAKRQGREVRCLQWHLLHTDFGADKCLGKVKRCLAQWNGARRTRKSFARFLEGCFDS